MGWYIIKLGYSHSCTDCRSLKGRGSGAPLPCWNSLSKIKNECPQSRLGHFWCFIVSLAMGGHYLWNCFQTLGWPFLKSTHGSGYLLNQLSLAVQGRNVAVLAPSSFYIKSCEAKFRVLMKTMMSVTISNIYWVRTRCHALCQML